ncbi:MAG TPA: endolytic transglycosylase MltG [Firmicutes bacterium]|nr:endolytic transglycosylase MltG [Bacillota bacterium]
MTTTRMKTTSRALGFDKQTLKTALRQASVLACLVLLFTGLAVLAKLSPVSLPPNASEVLVRVSPGMTSADIAKCLAGHGLVKSEYLFVILSRIVGLDQRLKAGYYKLASSMSTFQILKELRDGRVVVVTFTVPEGATNAEIASILEAKGLVDDAAGFERAARDNQGFLFPATYRVFYGASEEDIINVMLTKFKSEVLPLYEAAKKKGETRSLKDIITLASLVEKEARVGRERPLIAGVFMNRLRLGMPLQSCATVEYALSEGKNRRKSKLTIEDLGIESPYNTYLHRGLPPGPIANPGLDSIEAALNPARVDYLFFVANGDGTHTFSRTYREHLLAARKANLRPGPDTRARIR